MFWNLYISFLLSFDYFFEYYLITKFLKRPI
nr:MAG TPA: hypothetical protein [Bacteriophage sp.]